MLHTCMQEHGGDILEQGHLVILICFLQIYLKVLRWCAWILPSRVTGCDWYLYFVLGHGSCWPTRLGVNTVHFTCCVAVCPWQARPGHNAPFCNLPSINTLVSWTAVYNHYLNPSALKPPLGLGIRGMLQEKWEGTGESYIIQRFMTCNPRQLLLGWQNPEKKRWAENLSSLRRREIHNRYFTY
jgi:hypothetical protein